MFEDLVKLPPGPAARVLSKNNVTLQTPLDALPSASVAQVLNELKSKAASMDMMQLLAHALPAREATWWACLAARDMGVDTRAVKAAEAWVRNPGFHTRLAAREALDTAKPDDDTSLCALAACFADGTMGPGEFDDYPAPPGAVGASVYGFLLIVLFADEAKVDQRGPILLERGLDIARGGNGQIATPDEPKTPVEALTIGTANYAAPDDNANP